jgi:TonB family protein
VEKERDQQGDVIVGFVILADGRIENLRLIQASPHAGFNEEALASVHRSTPFPAIPLELGKNRLSLRIKLKFRLSDS